MVEQETSAAIWIVIVSYNDRLELERCLASVERSQGAHPIRVVVCDNSPGGETASWLLRERRSVDVMSNEANIGFGPAINCALRVTIPASAEYVVLLNPDTVVEPEWLDALVRCANSDKSIAIVQSKLLMMGDYDRPRINSAGQELHFSGIDYCGALNEPDSPRYDTNRDIPYAAGTAMLIRRKVLDEIGMFDDAMFMYHEDCDLGIRARLAGYRVVYCGQSVVHHDYQFKRGGWKFYHLELNRWLSVLKTYQAITLVVLAPAFALVELAVLWHAFRNGWFFLKLRSYWDLVRLSRHWMRERMRIQNYRQIPDRVLFQKCTASINVPGETHSLGLRLLNFLLAGFFSVYRSLFAVQDRVRMPSEKWISSRDQS